MEGGRECAVSPQETKTKIRRKAERAETESDGSIEETTPLGQWRGVGVKKRHESLGSHTTNTHTGKLLGNKKKVVDLTKGSKFFHFENLINQGASISLL